MAKYTPLAEEDEANDCREPVSRHGNLAVKPSIRSYLPPKRTMLRVPELVRSRLRLLKDAVGENGPRTMVAAACKR